MKDLSLDDVTAAWDVAPVTAIHPLRHTNETAYWQSGVYQAQQVTNYAQAGDAVVDFGCGDGRLTLPLARLGYHVYAVDASATMLKRVQQNLPDDTDNVVLVRSDGTNLLFAIPEPVDVVICRAVLIHHSHQDVERLVHAFSAVLKPGGHLICDWPVGKHYVRQNWTDVTIWTKAHRVEVAHAAGFVLVEDDTPTVWQKHERATNRV